MWKVGKNMKSRRLEVLQHHFECSPTSASSEFSSGLKYTLNSCNSLTPEERMFYEKHGYFVVRKLISEEKIQLYAQRFKDICNMKVQVPEITIMKDVAIAKRVEISEETVTKIQTFQNDPVLMEYCKDPNILKYVESFVGGNIMAVHTMLINKPPDLGTKTSRHPLHQDLHYFPFRPANRIVASWTAMQKITRENGCLVVLPGTHRGELLQHEYPEWEGGVNKLYHGVRDFDSNFPRVYLNMDVGDTVFFHPLLIHGSGSNSSTNFRKAISGHFASSYCHYIEVEGTLHSDLEKEIIDMSRSKLKGDLKMKWKDMMYMRSRVVKGDRISL